MPAIKIFDENDVRHMKSLFEDRDLPMTQIAEMMHCAPATVHKYLKDAGVDLEARRHDRRPNTPEEDQAEVIDWLYWGLGYSTKEVARALGITQKAAWRRMQRHGIPIRSIKEARAVSAKRHPYSEERRKKHSESMKRQWRTGNLKVTEQTYKNLMHIDDPQKYLKEAA